MRLMGMRFRDFTWRDNPVSLQVESAKNVAEVRVPYGESRAEELGQQRRKVTGEGYFSGADCMERWAALQPMRKRGRAGCNCLASPPSGR